MSDRLQHKRRDDRPWPPLPPERPGYFQWRANVEPVYGPPLRPPTERRPLTFKIVRRADAQR